MAFNGSGTYVLPGAALVDGQTISATEHNTLRNDMATAFTTCVTRDGQSPATANLPMGGFKLTGLAAGSGNGESVRYEQLVATAIVNTPAGGIAATTVQAAINELDTEKAALAGSASQNFATNALTASGGVQSISASALIGYGTGAGGTVTQTTSKSTAVTLNRPNGTIITTADALGAGVTARPNLINSTILSTSRLYLFLRTAGAVGAVYNVWVDGLADGVATIAIKNISGTSYSESIEIGFIVFGGSNS